MPAITARAVGWSALAAAVVATVTVVPPLVWPRPQGPSSSSSSASSSSSTPSTLPTPARPSAVAAFKPVTVQAADPANLREGGPRVIPCASCVAGRRVGYLGGPNTLAIHVRGVPREGERTLTIIYETTDARTLKVAVGSGQPRSVTVRGAGSWLIPATVTIRLWLPRGDCWIRFFNDTGSAPDLDVITVS